MMGTRALYRDFLQQLQEVYSLGEATVMTDTLFDFFAGIKKSDIILSPQLMLAEPVLLRLTQALRELLNHKPLQYVTGEAWFHNLKFCVNEAVLIPRPETEELVKLVIGEYKNIEQPASIIDIGTGSGCIAITLKKNCEQAIVTAIDFSKYALEVAKKNAFDNDTLVNFIEIDFLKEDEWKKLSIYNMIVSNPPYIPANEKEKMDKNVTEYEPGLALFVPDKSPLIFYEKIASFAKHHLATEGKIFMEVHEDYAKETAEIFTRTFSEVKIIEDVFGKQRIVTATNRR